MQAGKRKVVKKAKDPKDKVVLNLQIERGVKDALAKIALRDDKTSSQIVRRLIADYIRSDGRASAPK